MQLNLRGKLLILFFGLATVPMAAIGVVSYLNLVGTVEDVVEQRTLNVANKVAAEVTRFFEVRRSEIQSLARDPDVLEFYMGRAAEGRDALASNLKERLRDFAAGPRQVFVQIRYLDLDGRLVFNYGAHHGIDAGGEVTEDPSFDLTPHLEQDDLALANVHLPGSGSLLRLGQWVRDAEGERVGFVFADMSVDRLLDAVHIARYLNRKGENLVLIERGEDRVLFHSQGFRIGQPVERAIPGLAPAYARIEQGSEGWERYEDGPGHWLISYTNINELDWTVGILTRPSLFTDAVRRAGLINLAITIIFGVLIVVLIPLVVQRLTSAIRKVAAGAEAIAAGDLDQEIEVVTHDSETRSLAASFNRMAQSLKKTLGDLQALNEGLEARVLRRTAALEEANQTVQEQNLLLKREGAAQRMRNEALSIRAGDDMLQVVVRMWRELAALGLNPTASSVVFLDEEVDRVTDYFAIGNPRRQGLSWTSPDFREIDENVAVGVRPMPATQWKYFMARHFDQGKVWTWTPDAEEIESLQADVAERFGFDGPLPFTIDNMVCTCVPFTYGIIQVRASETSQEYVAVLQEFEEALSLGYLRFLNFQRLEEQNQALEQANEQIQEANRLKSDFLARMSHDLRTPMNAIIGYTRILLRKSEDALDERQFRNLENIGISSNNLLVLINDILDLSKIEAGHVDIKPEMVDLGQLFDECVVSVESLVGEEVELQREIAAVQPLRTDADRLRRVLMNLLSNAVKFTEVGRIMVSLAPRDEGVEMAVADTGIGIPAADLPYIFDEFRQVDGGVKMKEGTGLGLAIAKKSVELLGGEIWVESEEGVGTRFALRIGNYTG